MHELCPLIKATAVITLLTGLPLLFFLIIFDSTKQFAYVDFSLAKLAIHSHLAKKQLTLKPTLDWLRNKLYMCRYQINARTDLAIRYNDISPLENHHCAVAFKIFSNPETNIFGNLDSLTFKRIRSVCTDCFYVLLHLFYSQSV